MNKILRFNEILTKFVLKPFTPLLQPGTENLTVAASVPKFFQYRALCTSSALYRAKLSGPERAAKIRAKYPYRDRSNKVSVETSIKYMKSEAFIKGYGNELIWKQYRRNIKGERAPPLYKRLRRDMNKEHIPPTRKMCIRGDVIANGSPCPICRDELLVVDYRNIELLKQFISPSTGEIIDSIVTGVCQHQHQNLLVSYLQARDLGLLTFDVPFREYDYEDYKSN